jgi:hypothetical protein
MFACAFDMPGFWQKLASSFMGHSPIDLSLGGTHERGQYKMMCEKMGKDRKGRGTWEVQNNL